MLGVGVRCAVPRASYLQIFHMQPETQTKGTEFWRDKIKRNSERDQAALEALREGGWRVLIVWECALRGPARLPVEKVLGRCEDFARGRNEVFAEIGGDWPTVEGGQQSSDAKDSKHSLQ